MTPIDCPISAIEHSNHESAGKRRRASHITQKGTVKLSRICLFCRWIPLVLSFGINDLEAVVGGENAPPNCLT